MFLKGLILDIAYIRSCSLLGIVMLRTYLILITRCSVTLSLVFGKHASWESALFPTNHSDAWDMCEFICRFSYKDWSNICIGHCWVSSKVSCLYGYCTSQ